MNGRVRPKPGSSPEYKALLAARIEQLRSDMDKGGPLEAVVRAVNYVAMGQRLVDARSFETVRRILKEFPKVPLGRYKAAAREQCSMLWIDEKAAVKALPKLLPDSAADRRRMFEIVKAIRSGAGEVEGEAKRRLDEIEEVFTRGPTSRKKSNEVGTAEARA